MTKIDHKTMWWRFLPLLLGEALLVLSISHGLKFTSDSHLYLKGAQHFVSFGFQDLFTVDTFLAKPPIFSLLLALIVGNLQLLSALHVLLYGSSYLIFDRLLRKFVREGWLLLAARLLFVTSVGLVMVHAFVWTEPLFIFLLLIYLDQLWKYIHGEKNLQRFATLTLIALLLVGLKHVGIFFVLPVASILLIKGFRIRNAKTNHYGAVLHLLGPLLLFAWWHWQVYQAGNVDRLDHLEGLGWSYNLTLVSEGFSSWFVPLFLVPIGSIIVTVTFISLLIYLYYQFFRGSAVSTFFEVIAGVALIYVSVLLTKGDFIFSDNERYLIVLFPLLLLYLFAGLQLQIERIPKLIPYLMSISGLVMLYNFVRVIKNAWFWSGF